MSWNGWRLRAQGATGGLPASAKSPTKRCRLFGALAVLLTLVAGGFAGTLVGRFVESRFAPTPAIASQSDETGHRSSTIETIRVGQRVRTADANDCQNCATQVDPQTWRLVRMRLDDHTLPDGTPDPVDIESLQPLSWIREHAARPGAIVPVPLDLAEMGLPDDLPCRVLSVEACPPIESGSGRVVLNTVTHLNNYLFDLVVRDDLGRHETLRTTGTHKFKSATRADWVSADTLTAGETLEGLHGPLSVASLDRVPGTFRVYNLTVEGEHVYRVSDLGVLVHNTCPTDGHHIGPRQFRNEFDDFNIDIDDHIVDLPRQTHWDIHPEWNNRWDEFFTTDIGPKSIDDIVEEPSDLFDEFDLWDFSD